MNYYISEYQLQKVTGRTAGSKARDDVESILSELEMQKIEMPIASTDRHGMGKVKKALYHFSVAHNWKKTLSDLSSGDTIIIQFPNIEHSMLVANVLKGLKRRNVKIILLIHDLEILRNAKRGDISFSNKARLKIEEVNCLRLADYIISHNSKMTKHLVRMGVNKDNIVDLEIFDYLIDDQNDRIEKELFNKKTTKNDPVIIAGNLRRHKVGYVYDLPENVGFNLYGIGYDGSSEGNIKYFGSFEPDDLPFEMKGGFGLVWDGDSADTCSGAFGEYLRINNPHKTSLYIASGIPVIIWNQAALAGFVNKHKCGITVASLKDINDRISSISAEDYLELKDNAKKLAIKLQEGYYLKKALSECGVKL